MSTVNQVDVDTAMRLIRKTNRVSVSAIQRNLRIGYMSAAFIMDFLVARGVVGEPDMDNWGLRKVLNADADVCVEDARL